MLKDYAIDLATIPIYCDNISAISLTNNPMLHSRAIPIEVRHHLIRDHTTKLDTYLQHVNTEDQLADILTKPLNVQQFNSIKERLGIVDIISAF